MEYPLWATPQRRAALVRLFLQSGGFCVHGHRPCAIPEHHFEYFIGNLIKEWVLDDKALWKREQQLMHQMPDNKGWGRRYDPVTRELFLLSQPPYYLKAVGISGLTFIRIAKLRIPSTYMHLFVDVPKQSINQRRKANRYGKGTAGTDDDRCFLAVKDFWTKVS